MKERQSKTSVIGKRVKKAQSKAKSAGFFYLVGTIALLITVVLFPIYSINGVPFTITNFYQPLTTIIGGKFNYAELVASISYVIMLLVLLANALKSLAKFGEAAKRNDRNPKRYNKNARAMDKMGKAFSSSFAAVIILNLQTYLLQPLNTITFTMMNVYIILAIGLFVHFIAGLIGSKVSRFYVQESGAVEEEKRSCGLFVYFFRNLVQIIVVGVIAYFAVRSNLLYNVYDLVRAVLRREINIDALLIVGLQGLQLLWLMILIKHATSETEFNLLGIDGKGMRNFRVFSIISALTSGGLLGVLFMQYGVWYLDFIIMLAAAFIGFLIDCIFKSRPKEEKEMVEEPTEQPQQAVQSVATLPNGQNIYLQLPPQVSAQPQTVLQPIYVPVYYPPYPPTQQPYQQPAYAYPPYQQPVQNVENTALCRPAPSPAPEHLKPTPAPGTQAPLSKKEVREKRIELKARKEELKRERKQNKRTEKIAKRNEKTEKATTKLAEGLAANPVIAPIPVVVNSTLPTVEESVKPREEKANTNAYTLNPKSSFTVRCPQCGKVLTVKDRTPYHRCPNCSKVFTLRKFETYTKKEQ